MTWRIGEAGLLTTATPATTPKPANTTDTINVPIWTYHRVSKFKCKHEHSTDYQHRCVQLNLSYIILIQCILDENQYRMILKYCTTNIFDKIKYILYKNKIIKNKATLEKQVEKTVLRACKFVTCVSKFGALNVR